LISIERVTEHLLFWDDRDSGKIQRR